MKMVVMVDRIQAIFLGFNEMKMSNARSCLEIAGMDDAIVGYALRGDNIVLIYDFTKLVKLMMRRDKLNLEEAIEMAEAIEGEWLGAETPIVFHSATNDEIMEIFGDKRIQSVN